MVTASFVTDLVEIATQAAEAAAGIANLYTSWKNVDIARDYYDLYKDQRNFYYDVFQGGVEIPILSEIYFTPFYNKDYAARVDTLYNSVTGPFGGDSGDIVGWWSRHCAMYAQVRDQYITELETDTARIRSDWSNYLFRFEELWADVRNDRRWADRLMAHNIGLKQANNIVSSLTSSLQQYQENIADMGNQMATYGNGIALYAGYKRGMADTSDDFGRGTRYSQPESQGMSAPGMIGHTNLYDRVQVGAVA